MAHRAEKSGIAADIQKKKMETYPFEDEAKAIAWIEAVIDESLEDNFHTWLKDGIVLCKLINEIAPGSVAKKFLKETSMPFKQMECVGVFLSAAKNYGVSEKDCFVTLDLFEANDLAQVIATLFALDRKAHKKGWDGPILSPKEADANVREFSEQTIIEGKKIIGLQAGSNTGASQSGMGAPGTRRHIN
ncbi:Muscle-specific protein 20-like isoform X2 [Oopsacas minuta]|uniref:Muscle-specific protein 20-like isoform X2 n=1 Tax=Oopsacas minuta TaxID=111878 RepID=A0AAV7K2R5_9METZ|nr:Muscle-specific protein 20-like isoform X2 [Oopsacas minuta]